APARGRRRRRRVRDPEDCGLVRRAPVRGVVVRPLRADRRRLCRPRLAAALRAARRLLGRRGGGALGGAPRDRASGHRGPGPPRVWGTCTVTDWPAGSWALTARGAVIGPVTPGTDRPRSTGRGTAWETADTTESRALPIGVPSSRPPLDPSGRWISVLRLPPE